MKNLPLLLGTLLVTTAMILGVIFMFSNNSLSQQDPVSQEELVSTSSPHIKGAEAAEITIVEFSDFQCPACAASQELVNEVLAAYPEQVKIEYRHFPLNSIHPNAQLAAQATEVAAQEDKFWEYHDLLFANQRVWSELEEKGAFLEQLAGYAEELGIDKASFLERIESDRIKSLVIEDITAGGKINIQGTPTFYVNGQPSPASQLLKTVELIINS